MKEIRNPDKERRGAVAHVFIVGVKELIGEKVILGGTGKRLDEEFAVLGRKEGLRVSLEHAEL
jgi:hypothetical protein